MVMKIPVLTKDDKQALYENDLTLSIVYKRLRKGWTKEKAINTAPEKRRIEMTEEERYTMFYAGLQYATVKRRLNEGWSRVDAFTIPPDRKHPLMGTFTDAEMHVMFINELTFVDFTNRKKNGWNRFECIYVPKGMPKNSVYTGMYPVTIDELVTIYDSGSTLDTYRRRRAVGWSKEDAMTTPKRKN